MDFICLIHYWVRIEKYELKRKWGCCIIQCNNPIENMWIN